MAEQICGNEEEFVAQMNERAKGLGMENTHFVNCNGLDADGHLTTARDIALMSRELISRYPQIYEYCNIWMENITHTTKKGTSEFGLTNTNKLIRQYEYATGLKTGSTSKAKFCVSATAKKDDMELIAVIMAAEDSKARVRDAITLCNYGFGKCNKYKEDSPQTVKPVKIAKGVEDTVKAEQKEPFTYIDTTGADLKGMERKVSIKKKLRAPIKKGDKIGEAKYYLNDTEVGKKDIIASESVEEISYTSTVADTMEEAIETANAIASEHLEIVTKDPFQVMTKIRNAGAIFIGEYASEPLGDYFAGPNHVLPTNGTAKFFSPLGVDDFIKKSSLVYYSKNALEAVHKDVIRFAEAEGLTAHANSVAVRFEEEKG